MKKPFIPFGWLPGHWGLKGQTRELAEIDYVYAHDEYQRKCKNLELKLRYAETPEEQTAYRSGLNHLDFVHEKITEQQYRQTIVDLMPAGPDKDRALLVLQERYDQITTEEYEYKIVDLDYHSITDRKLAVLELDHKYRKVSDNQYHKEKATLTGESWVSVLSIEANDQAGSFELDWNDHFINELKQAGFTGDSDEDIVNRWFSKICRDIAITEFSGVGDFDDKLEERDFIKRVRREDGKVEVK